MSLRRLRRRVLRFERYAARYDHLSQPYDPALRLLGRAHARAVLAEQRERARRAGGWCVRCGCTDDRACPGGCSWVEPGLCSACVPPSIVTIDTGGLL